MTKKPAISPCILVVEDDMALNDAFCMVLRSKYPNVHGVYNGKDALDHLKKHHADLIFLDILMPIMDGREFLRSYEAGDVPIVVLSNLDARSDIEDVIKLGATSYILKSSASPQEILETAANYLP